MPAFSKEPQRVRVFVVATAGEALIGKVEEAEMVAFLLMLDIQLINSCRKKNLGRVRNLFPLLGSRVYASGIMSTGV